MIPTVSSDPSVGTDEDEDRPSKRQKLARFGCIFFNVLCGLTNGYDVCVISALLRDMVRDLELCGGAYADDDILHCSRKQAVLSIAAAGSLTAKVSCAWIADAFGRRAAILLVDIFTILGACLQCFAADGDTLLAGRFILGLGIGLAFVVEPTYLCEIAPSASRGRYVVFNEVAVCVGCLGGLQIGTAVERNHADDAEYGAWRFALAIGCIPALLQLPFIYFLPESPRWLAVQGDVDGVDRVAGLLGLPKPEHRTLRQLALQASGAQMLRRQRTRIRSAIVAKVWSVCEEQKEAWTAHWRSFLVGLGFMFFVMGSGCVGFQGYGADVLRVNGVDKPLRLLPFIGWLKLAGAIMSIVGADAKDWGLGRRRLAIFGSSLCSLACLILAWNVVGGTDDDPFLQRLSIFAFFAFFFAWNAGYGGLQFVVTLETLPSNVRSLWAGQIAAIVGLLEISILQWFESALLSNAVVTFFGFALLNFLAILFAAFVMSDLEGNSLEKCVTIVDAEHFPGLDCVGVSTSDSLDVIAEGDEEEDEEQDNHVDTDEDSTGESEESISESNNVPYKR